MVNNFCYLHGNHYRQSVHMGRFTLPYVYIENLVQVCYQQFSTLLQCSLKAGLALHTQVQCLMIQLKRMHQV